MKLAVENLRFVRINAVRDVRPAAEAFVAAVTSVLDFRVGACHNIASGRPMVDFADNILATDVFGWADDLSHCWWRHPLFALKSPVPAACRYESEPFWINADAIHLSRPNLFLKELDLHDFEKRAMMRAAIIVPVHLPFGQIGAVSISPRDETLTDLSAEFEAYGDLLGLYARTFIAGYVSVMCEPGRLPSQLRLCKREVECLQWAAKGKTDGEISELMSITRSTVRFHMSNAMTKLNAVNRGQTVLKAAQLGYINPSTRSAPMALPGRAMGARPSARSQ